jgi:hypothetical protein
MEDITGIWTMTGMNHPAITSRFSASSVWKALVAFGVFGLLPAFCTITSSRDIGDILKASHDVVVCRILEVPPGDGPFRIQVARSAKGNLKPGAVVEVLPPQGLRDPIRSVDGEILLFVGKRADAYQVIALSSGAVFSDGIGLPVPEGPGWAGALQSAEERVLAEVLGALVHRLPTSAIVMAPAVGFVSSMARGAGPGEDRWLRWIESQGTAHAEVIALMWRVARSDARALDGWSRVEWSSLPAAFRVAIGVPIAQYEDPSPQGLEALGRFIRSGGDVQVAQAAISALVRIGGNRVLPYLLTALDEPNSFIQGQVIRAMDLIARPRKNVESLRRSGLAAWRFWPEESQLRDDPDAAELPRGLDPQRPADHEGVIAMWRLWASERLAREAGTTSASP